MKTIEGIESGARSFLNLYDEIMNYTKMPKDFIKLLEDYYKEQYEHIKEMMND